MSSNHREMGHINFTALPPNFMASDEHINLLAASPKKWETGLFSCMSEDHGCAHCLCATCCLFMVTSKIADRLGRSRDPASQTSLVGSEGCCLDKSAGFALGCIPFFLSAGFYSATLCSAAITLFYTSEFQNQSKIPENQKYGPCQLFWGSLCCYPCLLAQVQLTLDKQFLGLFESNHYEDCCCC